MSFFSEHYNILKTGHIIFVIYWMAGLLYLPRLFVYHHQAIPGGELDATLKIQEKRLLKIILLPALIGVWGFGLSLLAARPEFHKQIWFVFKFLFVLLLTGLQHYLSKQAKIFARGGRPRTERFFRILNEVPAIATIFIVALAVLKPF